MLSRFASLTITRSPVSSFARQSLLGGLTASSVPVCAAGGVRTPAPTIFLDQQIRTVKNRGWAFTKQRQKRMARKKKRAWMRLHGIPVPKPPNYMPKDLPVINAVTDEERKEEIRKHDSAVTAELHGKLMAAQSKPALRFQMTEDLRMSDRVRKLFDLHNGNQKEVVKAQKQKGMEVFQLREGDTGSSAVQGKRRRI